MECHKDFVRHIFNPHSLHYYFRAACILILSCNRITNLKLGLFIFKINLKRCKIKLYESSIFIMHISRVMLRLQYDTSNIKGRKWLFSNVVSTRNNGKIWDKKNARYTYIRHTRLKLHLINLSTILNKIS